MGGVGVLPQRKFWKFLFRIVSRVHKKFITPLFQQKKLQPPPPTRISRPPPGNKWLLPKGAISVPLEKFFLGTILFFFHSGLSMTIPKAFSLVLSLYSDSVSKETHDEIYQSCQRHSWLLQAKVDGPSIGPINWIYHRILDSSLETHGHQGRLKFLLGKSVRGWLGVCYMLHNVLDYFTSYDV